MLRLVPLQLKASKKAIPSMVLLIILTQSVFPLMQAWSPDPEPDYKYFIIPYVQTCNPFEYPERQNYTKTIVIVDGQEMVIPEYQTGVFEPTRNPLKWWLNCVSYKIFDTPKLVPIFFNISLMPLVYLLTVQLTKDRFIGLLALGAFVANPLYSNWISSGIYDQVWSFFLILSVYLMYRFKDGGLPYLSFFVSLTAKTLGLLYLPAWFYSYIKTESSKTRKIMFTFILFALLACVFIISGGKLQWFTGGELGFHPENEHDIIYRNFEMLWEIVLPLVFFVLLSTNFRPEHPSPLRLLCVIWMVNGLFTTVIIYLFSNQFQFVYRFVPFAVFMSIFVAVVFVDTCRCVLELILKRQSRHK